MNLFSMITEILLTPYFSSLMILCSLVLFIIYGLEVPDKFPRERGTAKWGSLVYLVIGVLSFIIARFV